MQLGADTVVEEVLDSLSATAKGFSGINSTINFAPGVSKTRPGEGLCQEEKVHSGRK